MSGLYRVFNRQGRIKSDNLIDSLKELVVRLHDLDKPDYIFLHETSATPYGYLIKEAWKRAYGGEPTPKFFRIDPRIFGGRIYGNPIEYADKDIRENYSEKLREYFEKRIRKKDAKIVIFDENTYSGKSLIKTSEAIKQFLLSKSTHARPLEKIKIYHNGASSEGYEDYISDEGIPSAVGKVRLHGDEYFKVTERGNGLRFTAQMIKSRLKRKIARDYIHDLKIAGRELGDHISVENQKRRSLEQILASIMTVGCLILGLGFLSSTLTGNAIADLSVKTSSSIWIVLFVITLIAGFFWLKSRNK